MNCVWLRWSTTSGCLFEASMAASMLVAGLLAVSVDAIPGKLIAYGRKMATSTGTVVYTAAYGAPTGKTPSSCSTDTGTGMDAATKAHIFEPFFTTKELGKGTGLGLATTYGIIKQSDGSVIVDSEPGHGTTFRIYFPMIMREAGVASDSARRPQAAAPTGQRSGRILLVEDEPGLRDIAQRVLARSGFEVTAAADPDEAILAAESMTEHIDLLLTDVVMPGMRGPELAIRLRASRPGLRVLLVSGYAEEIVEGGRDDSVPFLAKPFSAESLLTAVDAAMSSAELGAASPEPPYSSETPGFLIESGPRP